MDKTALIAVDLQNDFISGTLRTDGGFTVVDRVNQFARKYYNVTRFASMDWHEHMMRVPALRQHQVEYGEHCIRNTWGAELDPSFNAEGYTIVRKGQQAADPSAFCGVEAEGFKLDTLLRMQDVRRVFVMGLVLDVCVEATALDALDLGYEVEVNSYYTVATSPCAGRLALRNIAAHGGKVV